MPKILAIIAMLFSYIIGTFVGTSMYREDENIHTYTCEVFVTEVSSSDMEILMNSIGEKTICVDGNTFVKYNLPEDYHPHLNHSKFQPFMDYRSVKNKRSGAYKIINHKNAYSDKEGFRRLRIHGNEFSIGDDYLIALGNYYKKKGSVGDRFLIITSSGMYTATVGDEKSDHHTDKRNMFTIHGKNRQYAGVIEWIVDSKKICKNIKRAGSITTGDNPLFQGDILHIYKII